MLRSLTLVIAVIFAAVAGVAHAQDAVPGRVAIVIGNGEYTLGKLTNPPNDANLVAGALDSLGFEVFQAVDLTYDGFETFYDSIADKLQSADVLFVYYAGHAFQYRGDNRLLMVDATAENLDAIISKSLSLTDLVARFAELNPNTLVLALDSCRDNPFLKSDEIESGLSYLETGEGQVMIGYATSAGQVAYDGFGSNSPYAVALSNALIETSPDGRSLTAVFRDVRRQVREATGGLQIPWVSSSVEQEVMLAAAAEGVGEVVVDLPDNELPDLDEILWYFVHKSRDPEDLQAYLDAFPSGSYVSDARTIMTRSLGEGRGVFVVGGETPADPNAPELLAPVVGTTGDRSPPVGLKEWPLALPPTPDGLGAVSDECAALASDPDDPARLAPGVSIGLINIRKAVSACVVATLRNPDDPRTLFHMGRTLDAAGRYAWAAAFYERAVAGGYGEAMVNLGFNYLNGRGFEVDERKAYELYWQAALLGNPRARTNLGSLFRQGRGVEQSYEEALLWYRLAGSNGWPNAIDALAGMYSQGQGVEKSPEQAFRLYQLAAEVGNTNAMNNLGRAYLTGSGVEADPIKGVAWLEAGVENGNRFAAQSLGRYIVENDGDTGRAEELFLMSAERGQADARVDLAELHRDQGNASEALYQIMLADAFGVEKAADMVAGYREPLSADEVAAVERRVTEWLTFNGS
jgi:uncharacterized protein